MNKKVREIVSLILELLTGALSLMLASYLFKSFYVESLCMFSQHTNKCI